MGHPSQVLAQMKCIFLVTIAGQRVKPPAANFKSSNHSPLVIPSEAEGSAVRLAQSQKPRRLRRGIDESMSGVDSERDGAIKNHEIRQGSDNPACRHYDPKFGLSAGRIAFVLPTTWK